MKLGTIYVVKVKMYLARGKIYEPKQANIRKFIGTFKIEFI
jgi:hypothetical protein